MKGTLEKTDGHSGVDWNAPSRIRSDKMLRTRAKPRPSSVWQSIFEPYTRPMTANASTCDSVFSRRTARAEMFRKQNRDLFQGCDMYKEILATVKVSQTSAESLHCRPRGKGLLDLPAELRMQIYALVVVKHECLVYPTSTTGREQPDLAMTSRMIRAEVLPLFYSQNTFALEMSPLVLVSHMAAANISAIESWAHVLTEGGWFQWIRKWIFCYAPPFSSTRKLHATGTRDQFLPPSVMVSLVFPRQALIKSGANMSSKDDNAAGTCSLLSPSVEVHEDAFCLLPSHNQYGMCCLNANPGWLNKLIIEAVDVDVTSDVTMEKILRILGSLEQNIRVLGDLRCCRKQVFVHG